jgi:hypothetical protein
MLLALRSDGERGGPTHSGERARCPHCEAEVIGKCGPIVIAHWAHLAEATCDPWAEQETDWHRSWKQRFLTGGAAIEVTLDRNGVRHRADVELSSGRVLELQHSSISVDELREREFFYRELAWLFDVREPHAAGRFGLFTRDGYLAFRWQHPRKHIAYARAPAYLDLGLDRFGTERILRLGKMHLDAPCRGWGRMVGVNSLAPGLAMRATV